MTNASGQESRVLTLREFTGQDVDHFYQLESNPAVVRFQTWPPRSREESIKLVQQIIGNKDVIPRRHVEMAVQEENLLTLTDENTATEFVGRVGCWIEDGAANLWFSFLPASQGRGYATQATKKLIEHLHSQRSDLVPFTILQIECDPRNVPSWKLAEKLGFKKVKEEKNVYECKGEWVDSVLYEKAM